MADSPRWCAECKAWGDHHTDRHLRWLGSPNAEWRKYLEDWRLLFDECRDAAARGQVGTAAFALAVCTVLTIAGVGVIVYWLAEMIT